MWDTAKTPSAPRFGKCNIVIFDRVRLDGIFADHNPPRWVHSVRSGCRVEASFPFAVLVGDSLHEKPNQ